MRRERQRFVAKGRTMCRLTRNVERHEPLTLLAAETSENKKITSFNSDPNVKHF